VVLNTPIFLGFNAVYSTESQPTFWRNMPLPSSGSEDKPSKQVLLAVLLMLVSRLDYPSTLNMVAVGTSETLADFQHNAQRRLTETTFL
jgi:hypothetical protein